MNDRKLHPFNKLETELEEKTFYPIISRKEYFTNTAIVLSHEHFPNLVMDRVPYMAYLESIISKIIIYNDS